MRKMTHYPGARSASSLMLPRHRSCGKKINASLVNEEHCWDHSSHSLKSKSSSKPQMTIWQVFCRRTKTSKIISLFHFVLHMLFLSLTVVKHMQYFVDISKQNFAAETLKAYIYTPPFARCSPAWLIMICRLCCLQLGLDLLGCPAIPTS